MKTSIVFLLLQLGAALSSVALAQSPGRFAPTGEMTSRRFFHTATLLTDGRVLITGGTMMEGMKGGPNKTLRSAEIYDPVTGAFGVTGEMTMPRDGHTATLLPDGKVLIAGGAPRVNGVGYSSAYTEIFDPSTGTFTASRDMTEARSYHTATLLNNGLVLIAGGFQRPAGSLPDRLLASAELYDPSTGMFTATGTMNEQWADTATLLVNGKVLITRSRAAKLYNAELYDPATGTFSGTGKLGYHSGPTATLLTNGKVLVAGGDIGDGDGPSVVAELYDPDSGTFARTGDLAIGREQHSAALLPDGTVLFSGGHNVPNLAATAEIYDPITGEFKATGRLPNSRELHTATLLNDGRVLIAGGDDERYWIPETILSSAELYIPQVLVPAPVLLALSADGKGQGAILHANTPHLVSSDSPAVVGEALEIYLTGLTNRSVVPPRVAIGGRMAEVLWFGNTPGYAGLNQINVRVPAGLAPGPAVPVRLTYIGRPSNEVTIGVQ